MAVSGEFRYFGPAFSSEERVRPVKAMTLPFSLAMGNITRLRNLEYMAAGAGPVVLAFGAGLCAKSPPCLSKGGRDKDGAPSLEPAPSFQENRPLSRRTSSANSFFRRSRRRKPESGAYTMRKELMIASVSTRP